MSWDFETEPEYQKELDWVDAFVREEVEPLDLVVRHAWDMKDPVRQALVPPLQQRVRQPPHSLDQRFVDRAKLR